MENEGTDFLRKCSILAAARMVKHVEAISFPDRTARVAARLLERAAAAGEDGAAD